MESKYDIRSYSLPIFGYHIVYLGVSDGIGWVRIFGKGFHWKDTTRHSLIFSERIGRSRALIIGKWRISRLK